MEKQKFLLALAAPIGITLMGLMLGISEMFMAGLVFTGLILVSAFLRRR